MVDVRVCPSCGSENLRVGDSRRKPGGYVYRRLCCNDCDTRFPTYEIHEADFKEYKRLTAGLNVPMKSDRKAVKEFNLIVDEMRSKIVDFVQSEFGVDLTL